MKTVEDALMDRLNEITLLYQDYTNNPFDVELTHDLRVSIRELRALLNVIKPAIEEEDYHRLNTGLKESAKVFGLVREIDVLTELCSHVAIENPDLSDNYYELFNFLDTERRQEMRRTFNKTNVELIEETLKEVRAFIEDLEDQDLDVDWDKVIAERLKKKEKNLQQAYDELDMDDYEAVHSVRKDAKKNRYGATYFKKVTSLKTKALRKESEAIQDELGEITDRHINDTMLQEFAEKVEKEELVEVFNLIRDYLNEEIGA